MKSLFTFLLLMVCIVMITFFMGCDILSLAPPPSNRSFGNNLVINEVFSISPKKFNSYSWIEIYNPTRKPVPLLQFTIPVPAFVVGAHGTVLFSSDIFSTNGGKIWDNVSVNTAPSDTFSSASFFDQDTGYFAGPGGILKKMVYDSASQSYQIRSIVSPGGTNNLNCVYAALDAVPFGKLILAAGDNGTYIFSSDYGNSFRSLASGTSNNLRYITYYVSSNTIFIVGDKGLILEGHFGQPLTVKSPPPTQANNNYYSGGFFQSNLNVGYIVGDQGAIARTTNAGVIWKSVPSGTNVTFHSIFIPPFSSSLNGANFDHSRGWIVGDHGTILRLDDSILTKQESHTTNNLYSVNFIDSVRGWVSGDGGIILATTDAGQTWQRQATPTSYRLLATPSFPVQSITQSFYMLGLYAHKERINGNVVVGDTLTVVPISLILGGGGGIGSIGSGGFIIVSNDSTQMIDHVSIPNTPTGVIQDYPQVLQDTDNVHNQVYNYKWELPDAGEIRLYYVQVNYVLSNGPGQQAAPTTTAIPIDVVRWGGFQAVHNEYKVSVNLNVSLLGFFQVYKININDSHGFPQNIQPSAIPELQSMARYYNVVDVNVNTENTSSSFYFTTSFLPGWPSLRGK